MYSSAVAVIEVCPVPYDFNHGDLIIAMKMNDVKIIKPQLLFKISD